MIQSADVPAARSIAEVVAAASTMDHLSVNRRTAKILLQLGCLSALRSATEENDYRSGLRQ
jgi:hypothetical protein